MSKVVKVEKVCKLFQPEMEWLYGYAKSCRKVPTIKVDASDTGKARKRAVNATLKLGQMLGKK